MKSIDRVLGSELTPYGFRWGPALVERCASHKGHVVFSVTTDKEIQHIRVTPSGVIRIDSPAAKRDQEVRP